jgi:hypothetical protein
MTEQEVKDKLYEKDIILEFYKEFELWKHTIKKSGI